MNVFLISFNQPFNEYDCERLKKLVKNTYQRWWNHLRHTYIVATDESLDVVVDKFKMMITSVSDLYQATFIAVQLRDYNDISGYLQPSAYDWLRDNLELDKPMAPHEYIDTGRLSRLFGGSFNRWDLYSISQVDRLLEPLNLDPIEYNLCRSRLIDIVLSNLKLQRG